MRKIDEEEEDRDEEGDLVMELLCEIEEEGNDEDCVERVIEEINAKAADTDWYRCPDRTVARPIKSDGIFIRGEHTTTP